MNFMKSVMVGSIVSFCGISVALLTMWGIGYLIDEFFVHTDGTLYEQLFMGILSVSSIAAMGVFLYVLHSLGSLIIDDEQGPLTLLFHTIVGALAFADIVLLGLITWLGIGSVGDLYLNISEAGDGSKENIVTLRIIFGFIVTGFIAGVFITCSATTYAFHRIGTFCLRGSSPK